MTRRLLLLLGVLVLFVGSAYAAELNYWIEPDSTGAPSKVWVKVPYIPAGGNVMIYAMPQVGYSPNGKGVFIYIAYPDAGIPFDTNEYTIVSGSGTVSTTTAGYLTITNPATAWAVVNDVTLPAEPLEIDAKMDQTADYGIGVVYDYNGSNYFAALQAYAVDTFGIMYSSWSWASTVAYNENSDPQYVKIVYDGTTTTATITDAVTGTSVSLTNSNPINRIGVVTNAAGAEWYYIIVRKYAPQAPTVSVTYNGTYYTITITNPNSTALTDFQVAIPATDLNVTSTTESIHFSDTPFSGVDVAVTHTPTAQSDLALDPENNVTSVTVEYNAIITKVASTVIYYRAYDGDSNTTILEGNTDVNYITFSRTYSSVGDYNTCVFVEAVDDQNNVYTATSCDVVHIDEYPQNLTISASTPTISNGAVEVNFEANAWDNGTLTYSWSIPSTSTEQESWAPVFSVANSATAQTQSFTVTDAVANRYLIPNRVCFQLYNSGAVAHDAYLDINIYDSAGNLCYTGRTDAILSSGQVAPLCVSSFTLRCATPPTNSEKIVAQASGTDISFYDVDHAYTATEGNLTLEGNVTGGFEATWTATTSLVSGQVAQVIFPGAGAWKVSATATDNLGLSKTTSINYNVGELQIKLQDSVTGAALTSFTVYDFNTGQEFNDGGTGTVTWWYPIVPAGWHKIEVKKAGYLDTNYWVYLPVDELNAVTLRIHPITAIVVTLTDEDTGAAISSFRVVVSGPHYFEANTTTGTLVIHPDTDLNLQYGEYTITVYPLDSNYPSNEYRNYYLNITRDWILSHGANFDLHAYAVKTTNVVWQTIQVVDNLGRTVQGARITVLRSVGGALVPVAQGITNYSGEVTIPLSNLQQYQLEVTYTSPTGVTFKQTQTITAGVALVVVSLESQNVTLVPPDVIVKAVPEFGQILVQPVDTNSDLNATQHLATITVYSNKGSFLYIKYDMNIVTPEGNVVYTEHNIWTGYPSGVTINVELNNAEILKLFPVLHVPAPPPQYMVEIQITYDHTEVGVKHVTISYTLVQSMPSTPQAVLKSLTDQLGGAAAFIIALIAIFTAVVALIAVGRPVAFFATLMIWAVLLMYAGWLSPLMGFTLVVVILAAVIVLGAGGLL